MVDLSPFWQTVFTIGGAILVAILASLIFVVPRVAIARLKANPRDELGLRLALVGVFLRAFRRSKLAAALPIPPLLRLALDSVPGSDPPAERCARTSGCSRIIGHGGACLVIDPEATPVGRRDR